MHVFRFKTYWFLCAFGAEIKDSRACPRCLVLSVVPGRVLLAVSFKQIMKEIKPTGLVAMEQWLYALDYLAAPDDPTSKKAISEANAWMYTERIAPSPDDTVRRWGVNTHTHTHTHAQHRALVVHAIVIALGL